MTKAAANTISRACLRQALPGNHILCASFRDGHTHAMAILGRVSVHLHFRPVFSRQSTPGDKAHITGFTRPWHMLHATVSETQSIMHQPSCSFSILSTKPKPPNGLFTTDARPHLYNHPAVGQSRQVANTNRYWHASDMMLSAVQLCISPADGPDAKVAQHGRICHTARLGDSISRRLASHCSLISVTQCLGGLLVTSRHWQLLFSKQFQAETC